MSSTNASSLGLKLRPGPFGLRINGVGGSADVQIAHIKDFGILNSPLKDVDFIVGGTDTGYGLLGANLLDAADLELDLAHGKVTLFSAKDCSKSAMAYWTKDGQYNVADIESTDRRNDRRKFLKVTINGHQVRALLDSGAFATVLGRSAAQRIDIDLNAPGVKEGGTSYGVGAGKVKNWTVRIDSFSVGTETIQHSQMQVIDGRMGDRTDLLLGVDFLLAHHIYIANSQRKVYFTYNGGSVFSLADAPGDANHPDTSSAAGEKDPTLKTASDFALRGQAHLSQGKTQSGHHRPGRCDP